jgi:DNA ligase-1
VVEHLLDRLDPSGRFALLKLVTGGLRVGVSARLAKQALADLGGRDVTAIEELWHGLSPPYAALFAWLTAGGPPPQPAAVTPFRPVMLSHALEETDLARLDPADFAAEWKWDGIRVQATADARGRRLWSRTGDDIGQAFPELLEALDFDAALDGELLVRREDGGIATFSDLQQRLNRKAVTPAQLRRYPAHLRAYDLLQDGLRDLRPLPFAERRTALEALGQRLDPTRFDLSPLLPFATWEDVAALRAAPPDPIIEGVMLKRRDSPYVPGRPKGLWFKWKRDPHSIDAVLIYAQRGHGKRSGYYSDYTFAVWTDDDTLTPVGKAYFGFTDAELALIDRWVRNNTTDRFGPVRAVRAEPDHGLVMEVAFEGLQRSTRHRSGLAMRFPRIARLRWDKLPRDADTLAALAAMLPPA